MILNNSGAGPYGRWHIGSVQKPRLRKSSLLWVEGERGAAAGGLGGVSFGNINL